SINDISRKFGIARKFQGANIFSDLTVYENLFVSYRKFASANILRSFLIGPEAGKDKIRKVLDEINLFAVRNLLSSELSHGQKQWLEIGMVMVQNPQIIILDEPTAGMTISETQKTANLIKQLSNEFSIIVVEHDMDFIKEVADKVTVLDHGRVIAEGDYETIKSDKKVADVYLNTEN
ncbi:MAG: ATP-binding cassette domain-containing protein, partial [Sporolactobacillus sp.]